MLLAACGVGRALLSRTTASRWPTSNYSGLLKATGRRACLSLIQRRSPPPPLKVALFDGECERRIVLQARSRLRCAVIVTSITARLAHCDQHTSLHDCNWGQREIVVLFFAVLYLINPAFAEVINLAENVSQTRVYFLNYAVLINMTAKPSLNERTNTTNIHNKRTVIQNNNRCSVDEPARGGWRCQFAYTRPT